jgi:hypothetical protein
MINVIETLFGIAISTSVAAIILFAMKRRPLARKFGLVALATGAAAVALELIVRSAA